MHYQVRRGDTLSGIASRYHTTVGALQRSNLDRLESGQQVRMYVRPGKRGPMAVRIEITGAAPPSRGPG